MFHSQLEREAYIKDMEDRLLKEFHKKKRPKEKKLVRTIRSFNETFNL